MIKVEKVSGNSDLKKFIDFPHLLYANDPNYVPELYVSQEELLNPQKHPFHKHSKVDLFLAYKNNKVAGRIAAIRNDNHNSYNNTKDAFFGFFDTIDDFEVAGALFDKVVEWSKKEDLNNLIGPVNFSTNETCGMLLNSFDLPPVVMMPYNKPYYNSFTEKYGFNKMTDLLAYIVKSDTYSDKSVKLLGQLEERLKQKNIIIRCINKKDFDNEAKKVKEVYNSAWSKNLGFVPMTDAEFSHMAKDMKMIYDPELCYIAEYDGKMIGFSLSIPDLNQVLINIKRGRLFPTGYFKLLFNKNKINGIRVITLGVIEGYRKLGIEACFYAKTIETCLRKNIVYAETSWILEHNEMMNAALVRINAEAYKRYRIYELPL
ncbi:MAG: hypothetical protein Q8880_06975 [Bacteroidota bacterium]|nr:hypothetical protein [Bacteroidota bacterium]